MTIIECLQALLSTLPKCHACDEPATRMIMSEHMPIPVLITCERGKMFATRGYSGPSLGAAYYTPTDGTWQWECCDDHPMPEWMKPMGSWDHPVAAVVRRARMIIQREGMA
jgi:hypothetical protein